MTKRLTVLVLAFCLIGALPAGAGKARVVEQRYNEIEVDEQAGRLSGYFGGRTFETKPGENFVSVEIIDDAGQVVAFDVRQGRSSGIEVDGCGTTDAPVAIKGGREVTVSFVHQIGDETECEDALPTKGIIRATFTK
jgi:hypothetical protein